MMALPPYVTTERPLYAVDKALIAMIQAGVCLAAAEDRLFSLARPRHRYEDLRRHFRRFGGLLSRKDFCRRAYRYLELHPTATPRRMADDLFRGDERKTIHTQLDPSLWYRRRIRAWRQKRQGLEVSA